MDAERYFNQSILRALDILEAVGRENGPVGLSELSRKVGLHKSTVHRLALSLESRGWLTKEAESGRYRIGVRFVTVARSGNAGDSFREIHPLLAELSEKIDETAILSVWDGREVICVDMVETSRRIQISSRIGSSFPICAGGTGLGVLIGMPEDMVLEIVSKTELVAHTARTITDPEELVGRYREMRNAGYVLSSGQVDPGVTGIAMPLYFPYEQSYGSIGVVLPDARAEGGTVERIVRELGHCRDRIRARLEPKGT